MWVAEIPGKHWVNVKRAKTQSQRETRENRVSENRGKTFNVRDYTLSYDWLIVSFTGPAVISFIRMNHRKTLIQREARTTIQRTWLFFELWLAHRIISVSFSSQVVINFTLFVNTDKQTSWTVTTNLRIVSVR